MKNYIKTFEIFNDLSDVEIELFTKHVKTRQYKKDDIIINEGEEGASLLFVLDGEIIVSHYFGGELRQNKDYDMILNNGKMKRTPFCTIINSAMNMNGGQARCEIKTKKTTVAPKEDYANSIARFSAHQDCDLYIFVRVLEDMTKAWITGVVPSPMFYKNATFHQRGEKDRSNNFTFHADCWNMSIKESLQLC